MQQQIEQPMAVVAVAAPSVAMLFEVWPFGLAFMAGFVALIYLTRMPMDRAIKSIVGSTFLGGTLAQLTAAPVLLVVQSQYPILLPWAETAQIPMTALIAILIGLLAQKTIPKLLNRAGRAADGKQKGT